VIASAAAVLVVAVARLLTGVRGQWRAAPPDPRPCVYFANHASHGDFVLVWTVLPPALRARTRPVAGADYWLAGRVRRYIARRVFDAVLIDRRPEHRAGDPIGQMASALDAGSSLILFPEGTRNTTEARLLPFRSGLHRLALARPEVDLVPVWIENLNRVMPKGELVPIPLLCTVTFGAALRVAAGEDKDAFLERARAALLTLAPGEPPP